MHDFVAFSSRWRRAWLWLVPIAFLVALLWMLGVLALISYDLPDALEFDPYSKWNVKVWAAWGMVGLLGVGSIVAIWQFFDTKEQLRIGPKGIRSLAWSEQMLPWSEIGDVTVSEGKRRRRILLHLRDPERFPARRRKRFLGKRKRKPPEGDVAISDAGIDSGLTVILAAIEEFRNPRSSR